MLPLCIQRALLHSDLPSFRTCTCTYTDVCHAIMIRCTSQTCVIPIPYHAVHFTDVCYAMQWKCDCNRNMAPLPCYNNGTSYVLLNTAPVPCHVLPCTLSKQDTKVFHYGGANNSAASRNLLCFSFQQPDEATGSAPRQSGFTYHIDDGVLKSAHTLNNFCQ